VDNSVVDTPIQSCDGCYFQIDYQGDIGRVCRLGHKFNDPECLKCRRPNES